MLKRIPEPDLMDSDEQAQAYASADFSDANKIFMSNMLSVTSSLHGKTILDVGCGDGEIIIDIKKGLIVILRQLMAQHLCLNSFY